MTKKKECPPPPPLFRYRETFKCCGVYGTTVPLSFDKNCNPKFQIDKQTFPLKKTAIQ